VTRILIVDDTEAVCQMLELTFSLEGFETETLNDGQAAVDRLDGEPTDVVVLDVMMPYADGFSVLQELRARPEWADAKVIVSTALKSDEDVWKGWSSGADYYLTKPFDLDHLRDVVQRLLAGNPVT